jgi:hypothetical protein
MPLDFIRLAADARTTEPARTCAVATAAAVGGKRMCSIRSVLASPRASANLSPACAVLPGEAVQ